MGLRNYVRFRTRQHGRGLYVRVECVERLAAELEQRRGEAGVEAAIALRGMEPLTSFQRGLLVDIAPFAAAGADEDPEVVDGIRDIADLARQEIGLL